MSNITVAKSRKRSLSQSSVEEATEIRKNEKKQKTGQEEDIAAPDYTFDKENESSRSRDAGRIMASTAASEGKTNVVNINSSLGADVDEEVGMGTDEENTSAVAIHTAKFSNAKTDQETYAGNSPRQRLPSPPKVIVPANLLNKKYDTTPPQWQPRQSVNLSAFTNSAPTQSTINGRTMVTASKSASALQRTINGYPASGDSFPEDFTLTELCTHYPNHLFGENLYPFLQYDWAASKIYNLLPSQSGVADDKKVTAGGIASRLRKAEATLRKLGEYVGLMNGPRTHAEL